MLELCRTGASSRANALNVAKWQSGKVARFMNKNKIRNLLWEIADTERLTGYCSECYRAVAHTRGGADGRQECCERGY